MCYIFNGYVKHGFFHNLLKKGRVVPRDVGNYYPITTLSALNKIFEKVISDRMSSYIESYNLISPHQYGFRKNSSTTLIIFDLITSILDSVKCRFP